MPFSAPIPATPAVTSTQANEQQPFHASGILADATHTHHQLSQAEREIQDRKLARQLRPGSVSEAQIHASKKRKVAIEFAHAYETYGEAMTGAPVTQAALTAALTAQTATITAAIAAAIAAESARRYNSSSFANDNAPLRRIPKTVPNNPDAPPAGVPNDAVGTRCPATIFPATKAAIFGMDQQQIDNLCAWYNQDLGIENDESIEAKRQKVLEFVFWG